MSKRWKQMHLLQIGFANVGHSMTDEQNLICKVTEWSVPGVVE
ncbi:MAG: hypothetical protein SFY66_04400 [Oculatellaceae cyanobacterium bins.114]|nr:hypothetical protein [Oculatellaceae cyanobacterium bins.114]